MLDDFILKSFYEKKITSFSLDILSKSKAFLTLKILIIIRIFF